MLSVAIVIPLLAAGGLLVVRDLSASWARAVSIGVATVPLALMLVTWARFDTGNDELFQLREEAPWIPSLGVAWRVGVDGIGLALALLTAVVFLAAIAYPVDTRGRPRQYYCAMLFLEGVSLGLFLTLDLLVFYVFFDLSLVGMFFLIGRWGHGDARLAALKFFLYTLAGSLVMLLGILGIYLGTDPLTFDMAEIIRTQPLADDGVRAGFVMVALLVGLAVKTPLAPVHTWLPPAHVDAPGPASAILAGVLLKMGTFGMVRLPYSMLRDTFERAALPLAIVATVSIVYGALVALGQSNLKRRIAYSSVNHMGYAVLGIAVAGAAAGNDEARRLALTGATVEMVAHGLITGVLFLIAGSFWQRGEDYELDHYGGLAGRAPMLAGATMLAAFASLGLPGLAGFVAEVQVFIGTFSVFPALAGIALIGLLISAALFLQLIQKLFFGELPDRWQTFTDLGAGERLVLGGALALVVLIGVYPRPLLDLIDGSAALLVGMG